MFAAMQDRVCQTAKLWSSTGTVVVDLAVRGGFGRERSERYQD
jgi:hypothetical protein